MTATGVSAAGVTRPPRPGTHPEPAVRRDRWRPLVERAWRCWLPVTWLVTFGLHVFRYRESHDLFIDEPFYTQVGQSVARGEFPHATGSLFFLHPPGFFIVEGAWIDVFGAHSNVFAQVYSIRLLVALIVACSAVLLGVVARAVLPRHVALLVAAVYVLDAYLQRQTSLVLLEPAAVFWTLAGYALLMRLPARTGVRWVHLVAVGLVFGTACLTKEFAVFITLVPLAVMGALGWKLTRREALVAIAVTLAPWAAWVVTVVVAGHWATFWVQVTSGFSRAAGTTQISGFNRPGAPSFLSTLVTNAGTLWTAYLVLGGGSVAAGWLAWRQGLPRWIRLAYRHARAQSADVRAVAATPSRRLPRTADPSPGPGGFAVDGRARLAVNRRVLAAFCLGVIPLIGYCILAGANEEQFFMFLYPPALLCLATVVQARWRFLGRRWHIVIAVAVTAALVSDVAVYTRDHTISDQATYAVDSWMADHVPPGSRVAVTNAVQRQVFLRYDMVDDAPGMVLDDRTDHLVVFERQVDLGYAFVDPDTIRQQTADMDVVFEFSGRSNGRVVVYARR